MWMICDWLFCWMKIQENETTSITKPQTITPLLIPTSKTNKKTSKINSLIFKRKIVKTCDNTILIYFHFSGSTSHSHK